MTQSAPSFSVIIPTRDRPELLRYAMLSAANQTFPDFEVVVCDNHSNKPAKQVFDEVADSRFRYVTPPSELSMSDNWEFASTLARGEYLVYVIDKTCLRPSALQATHDALKNQPAEIASWWNEAYVPASEGDFTTGTYSPSYARLLTPYYFDGHEELRRRFTMDVRRGTEDVKYYWGKLCFGAYHTDLVRRIRDKVGRLFYTVNPDYTSMISALAYARSALDLGEPLQMSVMTALSQGNSYASSIEKALNFLNTMDGEHRISEHLPLRGLYASIHNLVANDYVEMQKRIGEPMGDLSLDMRNLLLRAREDLDGRPWQANEEDGRREQYEIWQSYFKRLSAGERLVYHSRAFVKKLKDSVANLRAGLGSKVESRPRLRKAIRNMLGRPSAVPVEPRRFDSVIDALSYAEDYYQHLRQDR